MKLKDVDDTINENLLSQAVRLGIGGLAGAANYSIGARQASEKYQEEHFIDTFTRKINSLLSVIWPKVQKNQQEAAVAQQMMQYINANKPIIVAKQQINPDTALYQTYKTKYQNFLSTYKEFDLVAYLIDAIKNYASGYNLTQYMPEIEALCTRAAGSYLTDRGAPSIKKLGKVLFDIVKLNEPKIPDQPSETARVKLSTVLNMLDRMRTEDLEKLATEIPKKIQARL